MGWQTLSIQRKLLIRDLTLADNIGGTCKIEVLDGVSLEIYVYNEPVILTRTCLPLTLPIRVRAVTTQPVPVPQA